MRMNRKITIPLLLAVVFAVSLAAGPRALAYNGNFGDYTYFTGKGSASLQFIGQGGNYPESGISPSFGYVMPNRQSTYAGYGGDTGQGGAIGYNALGYNGTDNLQRKTALFNLLKKANQGSREWDKTGSALVVHQMLGRKAPQNPGQAWGDSSRTIVTPTEWDELERRLINNSNITMRLVPNYGMVGVKNTSGVVYYQNGNRVMDVVDFHVTSKDPSDPGYEYVWVFEENGQPRFALEVNCANPVGDFPGLPIPDDEYSLTPSISAPTDGASVSRGDSIEAKGAVKNSNESDAGTKSWYITRLVYDPGVNPANKSARDSNANGSDLCAEFINNDGCAPSGRSETFAKNQERTSSLSYTVPNAMAPGTKICFVVSVRQPTQNTNPIWRHSAMRCVTIAPPSFSLVPTIKLDRDDGSVVEPGDATKVTHTVKNEGSDRSDKTIWQLTRLVYRSTKKLSDSDKKGDSKDSAPCDYFTNDGRLPAAAGCEKVWERTKQEFGPNESISIDYDDYSVPADMSIGTKVCFAVSVSRPKYESTPVWRHSDMWCLTVGKKPKVQVWGGDVRAGGSINTSTSTIAGSTYGSWVEYAALSKLRNSGFSSGAGLGGDGGASSQNAWSKLTFANTGGVFGNYSFTLAYPSLVSQFVAGSTAPNLSGNLNGTASGVYQGGDVNISGGMIGRGKAVVIVATGTVTIEGDITYENIEYSNIRDIPQLIIRAPKIDIKNSVGRVDAWLLAVNTSGSGSRGALNTCSDYGVDGSLTADKCNNKLVINGPVVAEAIYLRRTGGSEPRDGARGEPAETFNLRADAFMWGSAYGSGTNRVQTVYSKELSPRF